MGTLRVVVYALLALAIAAAGALITDKVYSGRIRSLAEQRDAFEAQLKTQTANVEAANAAVAAQSARVREWQEAAERERVAREADRARAADEARRLQERVRELLGRPMPADCCGALEAVYARQREMIDATR